jgi:hypothetical protein
MFDGTGTVTGEPSLGAAFATAWCAVGGARGGQIVPRWFRVLPELGVTRVHLFWSMPDGIDAGAALDGLKSASARWINELRALGLEGDLVIKRGSAASWLTGLAQLSDDPVIVLGPSAPSSVSTTVYDLLREGSTPILLLPDLIPPHGRLLARPLIDVDAAEGAEGLVDGLTRDHSDPYLIDLAHLEAPDAVLTALRVAEEVDASLIAMPRRGHELVPYAVQRSNFPLLVWPDPSA